MNGYSRLDRLTHRLAFAAPGVQRAAAEIEDTLFARALRGPEPGPPIFIAGLPRAGTTSLLAALAEAPGLAAQRYRDMPFVMAPLLWNRLSAGFRKAGAARERAHGDGVAVDFDSPEAFEEAAWRALRPPPPGNAPLPLETARDLDAETTQALSRLFRKVTALRLGPGAAGRYLSKNNANIARLDLLPAMFPGAEILVPVRPPLAQAASLLGQHRRFAAIHAEDPFARRYMADLGHFEFGALHRPFAFPGFAERAAGLGPEDLDYWLAMWIAVHEHVAARRERLRLIDYAALCRPESGEAQALRRALALPETEAETGAVAEAFAARFRPPRPVPEALADHHGPLLEEAKALHARLAAIPAEARLGAPAAAGPGAHSAGQSAQGSPSR